MTVPVGAGPPAGRPVTVAMSWTTDPVGTNVPLTSVSAASWTVVVTTWSCQNFIASALSPALPSPLERVSWTPPTVTVVVARMVLVPVFGEVIATVHDPVVAIVVQGRRC